jgi:RND family efflux transporter MFP subunit
MKIILRIVPASLVLAFSAAACGGGAAPTAIPTVVLSTNPGASASSVTASGVIVPALEADLSFPLTGVVRTVEVQVGEQVTTGQTLIALDTKLLQAQAMVADADLRAEQIAYTYLTRTGTDQEHLESALADVARAQAFLDVANATLALASLTAPFDGTIASIDISASETVVPGQAVLTIGDLSTFRVETTDLSERDAPRVQAGQRAEVEVIALSQMIGGTVADLARLASTVGGDAVYKVTVDLDTQPPGLLWGMSATVRISTDN